MLKKKRKPAPKYVWLTIDPKGEVIASYGSLKEAEEDAVGPVFKDCRFVRYRRDLGVRVEEPKC